jgi:hypothetical protein
MTRSRNTINERTKLDSVSDYLELARFNGQWKIINVLWELKPKPATEERSPAAPNRDFLVYADLHLC